MNLRTFNFLDKDQSMRRVCSDLRLRPVEREALAFLLPLSADYPQLEDWFLEKVAPGLEDGTRKLLSIYRSGQIIGVGIGKRDEMERKICTVRIAPEFFGRGFGLKVFDELLKWLDTDQPHLTVSERKLPAFSRVFEYYGFQRTSTQKDRYLKGIIEIAFNEDMAAKPTYCSVLPLGVRTDHPN